MRISPPCKEGDILYEDLSSRKDMLKPTQHTDQIYLKQFSHHTNKSLFYTST